MATLGEELLKTVNSLQDLGIIHIISVQVIVH